jgi:hypothetical protein
MLIILNFPFFFKKILTSIFRKPKACINCFHDHGGLANVPSERSTIIISSLGSNMTGNVNNNTSQTNNDNNQKVRTSIDKMQRNSATDRHTVSSQSGSASSKQFIPRSNITTYDDRNNHNNNNDNVNNVQNHLNQKSPLHPIGGTESPNPDNDKNNNKNINLSHRGRAIIEIWETEQTYCANVELMIKHFFKPMTLQQHAAAAAKIIFNNIEQIQTINSALLKSLNERLKNFSDNTTKIGDVFLDVTPYLKPYYSQYSTGYSQSQEQLKNLEQNDPSFGAWLEQVRKDPDLKSNTIRYFVKR